MKNCLVDTNILLHIIRKSEAWAIVEAQLRSGVVKNFVSVISVGELRSFALQNQWGEARQKRMIEILEDFTVLDINIEEVIQRYAEIDAFSQGKLATKPSSFSARNMGKNDLWIAATAAAFDLEVLTTDRDFEHLDRTFFAVNLVER